MEPPKNCVSSASYECPVCGLEITRDLLIFLSHGRQHIFEILKREHPEWKLSDGACVDCEDYFERQLHNWKTKEEVGDDQEVERGTLRDIS